VQLSLQEDTVRGDEEILAERGEGTPEAAVINGSYDTDVAADVAIPDDLNFHLISWAGRVGDLVGFQPPNEVL
jgi:hypothetical protein